MLLQIFGTSGRDFWFKLKNGAVERLSADFVMISAADTPRVWPPA
jgi:hypothetical protein